MSRGSVTRASRRIQIRSSGLARRLHYHERSCVPLFTSEGSASVDANTKLCNSASAPKTRDASDCVAANRILRGKRVLDTVNRYE